MKTRQQLFRAATALITAGALMGAAQSVRADDPRGDRGDGSGNPGFTVVTNVPVGDLPGGPEVPPQQALPTAIPTVSTSTPTATPTRTSTPVPTATVTPSPQAEPYGAAKAGLNAITRSFAFAYGPKVRVNAIVCGPFLTDISKAWDMEAFNRRAKLQIPLHRAGEPGEIVGAALYLASDAGSYTTGSTLTVDGGASGNARLLTQDECPGIESN